MTDLYVEQRGEGNRAVVLIHSGISDLRMWDPLAEALAERYRVVAYDVRGFGKSPDATEGYYDHADVLAILDAHDIDRAVLIGASNGGRIALDTAVEAPERVRALVLLCSALIGLPTPASLEAAWTQEEEALEAGEFDAALAVNLALWVDGVRPQPGPTDTRDKVIAWLRDLLPRQAVTTAEALLVEPLVRDRLRTLDLPALVLVGEHDQPKFHLIAGYIAGSLPRSEIGYIDGAAHLPAVEQPDAVRDRILAFLEIV